MDEAPQLEREKTSTRRRLSKTEMATLRASDAAMDDFVRGTSIKSIAEKMKVSPRTVSAYIDRAAEAIRDRLTNNLNRFIAAQWQKLDMMEREAWALWKDLRAEPTGDQNPNMIKCLEMVSQCITQRLAILERLAPRESNHGVLIPVVEVLVQDRNQVRQMMTFTEFSNTVAHPNVPQANLEFDDPATDPLAGLPKATGVPAE